VFALTGRRKTKNEVAGCRVVHGSAYTGNQYRYKVIRAGEVLCPETTPASLNHFKTAVQEVRKA
jgi:hypothetical protein